MSKKKSKKNKKAKRGEGENKYQSFSKLGK